MSTYTRGEAAGLLAIAIGAPGAKDWLCGWSTHEIQCGVGCSHPANNLWSSGQPAPGATDWNNAHVKNYPSLAEGVAATAANLADPRYPSYQHMVHDLQQGNWGSSNVQAGLRTWCGWGCYSAGAANFPAEGRAHAGDLFDDSSGSGSGGGKGPLVQCVPCGPANLPCCPPMICSGEACITPAEQAILPKLPSVPDILKDPKQAVKVVLGIGLLLLAGFLVFAILTEKAAGNPAVKTVTKAAGALAA